MKKSKVQSQSGTKNPPVPAKAGNPQGVMPVGQGRIYYGALLLILLLSAIVYLPVLHNGFIWDDAFYIKSNRLLRSINLGAIFSQYVEGNYHPLTVLTLAVEYQFFGLKETGYHAVNLLLHLLNVALVYCAIFLLSDKAGVALVTALLFGIHPMHVESVAWVSQLKDLLYTFFFLASYIFYLKYLSTERKKFYAFALLLFLASLLSKAMAASLPVLIILTDYFRGRKLTAKIVIEKIPFFLLAIAFGVVAILAQKSTDAMQTNAVFTFPQQVAFACYGFVTYLFKLLLPLQLSAFYPYPIKDGAEIPIQYYLYIVLAAGIVAGALYSLRFSKKVFFGIGFFAVTVFLVLQLLPVGSAIMADRYSYIPSLGIFYLMAEGLNLLWGKKLKLIAVCLLSAFTVFFSVKTFARCGIWKDEITLWNDVISQSQIIPIAYNNRGVAFMREKQYELAMNDFDKAIRLHPGDADAHNNRGFVFVKQKKYEEALDAFTKAIELGTEFSESYMNRGNILRDKNRYEEALKDYNKAIELNPEYGEAYGNRGVAFMNEEKFDRAFEDFNKAIELEPDYPEAYNNRSVAFMKVKEYSRALEDCNKVIELEPEFAEAYVTRGNIFRETGRLTEALKEYNKAIELNPDLADAYFNRGTLFSYEKRNSEAMSDMNKAIELNADFAEAYISRGNFFYSEKRFSEAISNYSKVIELKADHGMAYFNRGLAKYFSGNKEAACMDMKLAADLGYKTANEVLQLCK